MPRESDGQARGIELPVPNRKRYLTLRFAPETIVYPGVWFHVACGFGANGSKSVWAFGPVLRSVCAFGPVAKSVCAFGPIFHRLYEEGAAAITMACDPAMWRLGGAATVFTAGAEL